MSIETIDFENKEDHQDKLSAVQNIPPRYWVSAANINALKARINQLVERANKFVTSFSNAANDTYPSTLAVQIELDKKLNISGLAELQITAAGDAINLNAQGKGCLSFTQSVNVTGIDKTGFADGQQIQLFNASAGYLVIKHNSISSSLGNRIHNSTLVDLSLKPRSWVNLRYSTMRSRWEIVNLYGTEMLASLANTGTTSRVVTVNPDGSLFGEPIMDFQVFDETATGFASLAAIVAAYPTSASRAKGFQVLCMAMTPPTLYIKSGDGDDSWIKFTGTKLT